jgi:predicted nucleic acid-binding protein
LKNYENKVFGITSVTEFEMFCVDLNEREVIMLDSLETCDFDKKAGRMPKIKDLLIAATCIANNKKLITGDGDFESFKKYGLDVEII